MFDDEEVELYSEILPALWQGGTEDRDNIYHGQKRLPTMGDPRPFDAVVSLCAYTQPVGWLTKEFRYAFPDGPVESDVYEEVERIADWAYLEWKSGSRVLIRCQAGLNRSGLVTGLVLLRDKLPIDEIVKLIRSKRGPYALSNNHFMDYLVKWGK
jgi:hypothetical protein